MVESQQGRKRESNLRLAKEKILLRLEQTKNNSINSFISEDRRNQVGSGERNDKIRTYRFKDNIVVDHNSGKTAKCIKVLKGNFHLLW